MKLSEIGLVGLMMSRKATMALLVLGAATWAVLAKDIDGTSYAAIVSIVSTIFLSAHVYQQTQSKPDPK